jgi:signal transduction histidine kinase/HAMP domain-containing protein
MTSRTYPACLSLQLKFGALLGAVVAALVCLTLLTYDAAVLAEQAGAAEEHADEILDHAKDARVSMLGMEAHYREYLFTGGTSSLDGYRGSADTLRTHVAALAELDADDPDALARWMDLARLADAWRNERAEPGIAVRRAFDGGAIGANQILEHETGVRDADLLAMRRVLDERIAIERRFEEEHALGEVTALARLRLGYALGLAAVLAALAAVIALMVDLLRRTRRLADAADAFAAGELDRRVADPSGDEMGALGGAFDAMAARLAGTLGQLAERGRAAEVAGQETRDQLDVTRAIVDAAGVAMVLVAPDSRPMIANGLIEEYLGVAPGITPAEFVALMPKIFADPSAALALGTPNLTAPDAARTAIVSILWPTPREVEARVIPVRKRDGTPIGRLLTFRDVTREREVDRLKTEFVALVSHELRTPLTSIKGYVDLLIDGEVGAVNDDQHDFLGVVQANADRLVRLIDDLLDVSAIEAGKVHLELAPTDPAALIRAVLPMLRTQIEAKGQTLTLDLPDDLPPVLADAARIAQVVTNLLSNANKYTPAGGAIGVSAHAAHGALRVSVSDSGIGLTAAERGKLFTKFFRADNRTTREVAGTGLGLAISQSMVELHGGAITVESDPGRGSTFSFTVPLAPAPQVAASSDPDAASAVRGAWMAVAAGAAQWG